MNTHRKQNAFSLIEMLTALMMTAIVLIAVLALYQRAERAGAAILDRDEDQNLGLQILQRIARDIDGIYQTGDDTVIRISNNLDEGFWVSRLEIEKTFYNQANKKRTFEQIIWQSDYDPFYGGIIVYRKHSGMIPEDKLLDSQKEDFQREMFVPIASGLSYFRIRVIKSVPLNPQGNPNAPDDVEWEPEYEDTWSSDELPPAIELSLSFGPIFEDYQGRFDVDELDKLVRTVAVDRTRPIQFKFVSQIDGNSILLGPEGESDFEYEELDETDANEPMSSADEADPNQEQWIE